VGPDTFASKPVTPTLDSGEGRRRDLVSAVAISPSKTEPVVSGALILREKSRCSIVGLYSRYVGSNEGSTRLVYPVRDTPRDIIGRLKITGRVIRIKMAGQSSGRSLIKGPATMFLSN
jgi:hypothetical protein